MVITIIGGGPAGYVAAIRAAQLGFKVRLIEKDNLGGTCLNWGCIPTKALLHQAEVWHLINKAEDFGIKIEAKPELLWKNFIDRSRNVAKKLLNGVQYLMQKNKITVVKGTAQFIDRQHLKVNNEIFEIDKVIIATGARPRTITGINAWTSKEAMIAENLPEKLVIIGGGVIGMEFASFFATLGTKVTVVEKSSRILTTEDKEIADYGQKQWQKKGIDFFLNSEIKSYDGKEIIIKSGDKITSLLADKLLVAVGVVPNTEELDLANLGMTTNQGFIKVNGFQETNITGIFAIGDVAGGPLLAHKASHEGVVCLEKIANKNPHPIDHNLVPSCIYTAPQIASVGQKEEDLTRGSYNVGRFNFQGNGKALAIGETEGFVKILTAKDTGAILGAHMVGHNVTELIHSLTLALQEELTIDELVRCIFPHPTLSEAIGEAALDALGICLHS